MEADHFDPINTELLKGINLIEASAGTGKTYTVAMLVLRFVVERNISIQKILLVTFTHAATEELKDRVRNRLLEARRALTERNAGIDASVMAWIESLNIKSNLIKQRLDLALLDIDQAGIFTIHGFCQRVLLDHALESGQLFNAEILSDLTDIKQACADDFWRRQIYPRPLWEAAVLTAAYKTPDDLLASIAFVSEQVAVFPAVQSLDAALGSLQSSAEAAKSVLDECANKLKNCFSEGKFKSSYSNSFDLHLGSLRDWLHGHSKLMPETDAFALLTEKGLQDALNGIKFKKNSTRSAEQRKTDYWVELNIDTAPFDALYTAIKQIPLVLRRSLLDAMRLGLAKQLQKLNRLSFDSLISRLAEVLRSADGDYLVAELQQRFAVALIDEFQDTDDSQWTIFSRIFAAPSHYLYLIGDPKQAIYKFRGADIYTYLDAQKQAQHRFTLGKNWRSHPRLVDAVNILFKKQRAFMLDELEFHNVKPALSVDAGVLCKTGKAVVPMICWQLPQSDSKKGYWRSDRNDAAWQISLAIANEVVDLLTEDFTLKPANRKIKPKDIAILVGTNRQARDYQALLRQVGVPSVVNSTESVFKSREAADLYSLLQAVAHPGNSRLLKQALTIDWFELDGQALYQLVNNETALADWNSRCLGYFLEWQQSGLMAMLRNLLTIENIEITLAKSAAAERRLTNLHHLIELLQQAVIDEHLEINKTLDWLRLAITKANKNPGSAENQQLRLESDEDAVQIVTMHRSKGLEYNIVFCPCLWQRKSKLQSEKNLIQCHENGRMIADLGSDEFERRRALALNEELAEDLRIVYVAVTRAKYRCYLVWADARSEAAENNSALAWLLDFSGTDFASQQSLLRELKEQAEAAIDYCLLEVPVEIKRNYQKSILGTRLQAQKRHRQLYTSWQMSSYTALSALTLHEAPELPEDKAGEQQIIDSELTEPDLPKGTHTGNVIHDLLENCTFVHLAERQDISALREKACRRYGLKLAQPGVIDDLLQTVVLTPLSATDTLFCLKNVREQQCLKEMPFYLSMKSLDANRINRILQDIPTYQPLNAKAMCGYLTGFIDLVCEYDGLFYVMDYKTNSLTDYSDESLVQAMQAHNYGLQYWIYSLVLHLYLQKRQHNYRYDLHFGGVRYLFVRGMQPERPMSGVFQDRPDLDRIEVLADAFGIIPC